MLQTKIRETWQYLWNWNIQNSINNIISNCKQTANMKHDMMIFELNFYFHWEFSCLSWHFDFFFFFFFLVFLRPYPRHMEVPRLGIKSELQLPGYATATAMWDLSCVCDLHHSSRQCRILNPLSKARDWTPILMGTGWVCYCWATTGTP